MEDLRGRVAIQSLSFYIVCCSSEGETSRTALPKALSTKVALQPQHQRSTLSDQRSRGVHLTIKDRASHSLKHARSRYEPHIRLVRDVRGSMKPNTSFSIKFLSVTSIGSSQFTPAVFQDIVMIKRIQIACFRILFAFHLVYAKCYHSEGTLASSDTACSSAKFSACCGAHLTCLSHAGTALCNDGDEWLTGSCTDQSWSSDACPKFCLDG